jgi:hypothetical protein
MYIIQSLIFDTGVDKSNLGTTITDHTINIMDKAADIAII